MNFDIYIKDAWFYIGLAMFFASSLKDIKIVRSVTIFLFSSFCIVASLKSEFINQDIKNYIIHFVTVKNGGGEAFDLFAGGFEPGYNLIAYILSIFSDKQLYLFLITAIPSAIFIWQFVKYKYSPSIIFYIYTTIILVSSTAIVRHYFSMALAFVVLNRIILDGKKGGGLLFIPALFHFSSILLIFSLLIDGIRHNPHWYKITGVFVFLFIAFFGMEFIHYLILKAEDRISGGALQSGGMRSILNLLLVFLLLYSTSKFSIVKKRMKLLLWISISISIALIPFYGLNRVTSFFSLVIMVFFYKYQKERVVNWGLSLISLSSLVFFYLKHSILG
jgi:hypothetical protein